MHFAPITESEVWPGGQRLVIGPPDDDPTGSVRAVEAVVDTVLLDEQPCPRYSLKVRLDQLDLEALALDGELWFSILGSQVPPMDVGLVPAGVRRVR